MAKDESSARSTSYAADFRECCHIGGGGQGTVYKAAHILDGKEYAVKKVRFKKSREEELLREVKALSYLYHANIIRYHTSWTEDGVLSDEEEEESSVYSSDTRASDGSQSKSKEPPRILYIQMELCMSTLRKWIDSRNEKVSDTKGLVLEKQCIIDIMRQILSAVEYIHSKQLIHRDLKPENILHSENNIFKIGDFGLAKLNFVDEAADNHGQYQVGTVPYRAPETEYNTKSDIYSVGVIMLEMCYKMNTTTEKVEVIKKLCKGEVPKELRTNGWKNQRKALRQMVQTNVEDRPSATDLINGPLFLTAKEQEFKILREKVKVQEKQVEILMAELHHAMVDGPATIYKPPSYKSKVRRLTQKLSIERKRVRMLTSQLTEVHAELTTPALEVDSPVMLASILSQHGATTFRSQREKDLFHRLCRDLAVLYRRVYLDTFTLFHSEIVTMLFQEVDEVGGRPDLQRLALLKSCLPVANVFITEDPSCDKKQILIGRRLTSLMSSVEYENFQQMDDQKLGTAEKKIKRRKRRGKIKAAGAFALT